MTSEAEAEDQDPVVRWLRRDLNEREAGAGAVPVKAGSDLDLLPLSPRCGDSPALLTVAVTWPAFGCLWGQMRGPQGRLSLSASPMAPRFCTTGIWLETSIPDSHAVGPSCIPASTLGNQKGLPTLSSVKDRAPPAEPLCWSRPWSCFSLQPGCHHRGP